MRKRNTMKKGKPCPFSDAKASEVTDGKSKTNDPAWYNKVALPQFGVNFAELADIGVANKVLPNGIRLDAMVSHFCALVPPVDPYSTLFKEFSAFYAEIRSRNSGAANYNPERIGAYQLKIRNIRALYHEAVKQYKAVRSSLMSNAHPWRVLSALVNQDETYRAITAQMADLRSRLELVALAIEDLPVIPGMSVFERDEFVFSTLFFDSKNTKPSVISFDVRKIMAPDIVSNAITFTEENVDNGLAASITKLESMVNALGSDGTYSILRGDLINRYHERAFKRDLRQKLDGPIAISFEDPEVMSQLENATLIATQLNSTAITITPTFSYSTSKFEVKVAGVVDSGAFDKGCFDEQLLNWHEERPATQAELVAITRFMPVYTKKNGTGSTVYEVTACDGIFVYRSGSLNAIGPDNETPSANGRGVNLNYLMVEAQESTVQSTMRNAMATIAFYSSVIDHFPMIITDENNPYGFVWDLDRFATVDKDTLEMIHSWAIRSMWMFDRE